MRETRTVNGREETVISVELMRRSDRETILGGVPGRELMGRAALGVYRAVEWKEPVAILAGGGNNGGDGYAIAALLARGGFKPVVFRLSDKLSEDGRYYCGEARRLGVPVLPWGGEDLSGYAMLVDALLGTGFQGQVRSPIRDAIERVNRSGAYVVSVDISSGLNGDTGEGDLAVRADITVSIGYYKLGLFRGRGPEVSGKLVNADIGISLAGD